MDANLSRRVEQQRVAMLYGNTLAVSSSALLMTAFVAVIAWPHAELASIATWCAAVLIVQVGVQWLSSAYRRAPERDTAPLQWGKRLGRRFSCHTTPEGWRIERVRLA